MNGNGDGTGLLFTPFNIGGKLALRNRIVLAPLWLVWDGRSAEFCLRDSIDQERPIRCLQNPWVGFEHEDQETSSE